MLRKKRIQNIPRACFQRSTPNTNSDLSMKHVADENWLPNHRPPTSCPPTPDPRQGNSPQLAPETNGEAGHTLMRETPPQSSIRRRRELGTGSGQTARKLERAKSSRIPRLMPMVGGGGRGWGNPTANPMKNPNIRQNSNTGRNPNQNPNARLNPNQNPNAVSNHNWNSNSGPNPNRNSNAGWKLRTGGNPNIG